MTWSALKDHLVQTAGAALLLAGSAAVVDTKVELARQDVRITRIEDLNKSIDQLRYELLATREALARIEARQESQRE